MQNKPVNINRIINEIRFKEYYALGLIDEVVLRKFKIKWDYFHYRKSMSMIDSIFTLADKYSLSYDSVNTILFRPMSKSLNPELLPEMPAKCNGREYKFF